jgi:hypothetical protein
MRALLLAAVVLAACAPPVEEAELWTVKTFDERNAETDESLGGWLPAELFIKSDAAFSNGLRILPGVSNGVSAPYVVTEVWQNHPEPWVQPVWSPRNLAGERAGALNIFSVDVDASFYSPFWKLELLKLDGTKLPATAREAIDSTAERAEGPLVVCPSVPDGVGLATGEKGPLDPATGDALALVEPSQGLRADGQALHYLDFGPERFVMSGTQRLVVATGYFFVDENGHNLPIAAVLPPEARRHPLLWRVDVRLPEGAGVYVPASRPELRAMLGPLAPAPSAANENALEFTLRAALNPGCFQTALASCQWLDRTSAIEALPRSLLTKLKVQATVVVLDRKAP